MSQYRLEHVNLREKTNMGAWQRAGQHSELYTPLVKVELYVYSDDYYLYNNC